MALVDAVREAISEMGPPFAAEKPPCDQAATELALTYARAIDAGGDLDRLGPQLLTVLDALLMTPKARAALVRGASDDRTTSPLDELRARRAARKRDTSAVDTAAS